MAVFPLSEFSFSFLVSVLFSCVFFLAGVAAAVYGADSVYAFGSVCC